MNSNVIDLYDPEANMYGCSPCPRCKSEYRYPAHDGTIQCDECGHSEKVARE